MPRRRFAELWPTVTEPAQRGARLREEAGRRLGGGYGPRGVPFKRRLRALDPDKEPAARRPVFVRRPHVVTYPDEVVRVRRRLRQLAGGLLMLIVAVWLFTRTFFGGLPGQIAGKVT